MFFPSKTDRSNSSASHSRTWWLYHYEISAGNERFLPDCHQPGSHAYLPRSWPWRWSLKIQRWLWRWHPHTQGERGWCLDWLEGAAWKVKLTLTSGLVTIGGKKKACNWVGWILGGQHLQMRWSTLRYLFSKKEGSLWHTSSFQALTPESRLSTWVGYQQRSNAIFFRKGVTSHLQAPCVWQV